MTNNNKPLAWYTPEDTNKNKEFICNDIPSIANTLDIENIYNTINDIHNRIDLARAMPSK